MYLDLAETTLLVGIISVFSRAISIFIIMERTIRYILREDNSISSIRKARQRSGRWEKLTGLCFWNAKTKKFFLLRAIILLRTVGVLTWGTSLLMSILYCVNSKYENITFPVIRLNYYFELFTWSAIAMYTMHLLRKKQSM